MKIGQGILIAPGELFLKSEGVKRIFKRELISNLSSFLKKEGADFSINSFRGRIFVRTEDINKAQRSVKNCFGAAWFAPCFNFVGKDLKRFSEFVQEKAKEEVKRGETFAIRIKLEKGIVKESRSEVIDKIAENIHRKVDLDHPDNEIFVEIRRGGWFLFFKKKKALGGLPVGCSGRGMVLVSGGIDSPAAAFLAAKRGLENIWIHFHSFPLVSNRSIEKVKETARVFLKYQPSLKVYFVPFQKIQLKIKTSSPPKYRVLLYRRFMLKIAQEIARKEGCQALVTGESLGQVSSQTLDNMAITQEAIESLILRPLVGLDKEEIMSKARKIKTYNISIKPQEDCCTLFVPKGQTAKGDLEQIKEMEKGMDCEGMIEEAIGEIKVENY